MPIYRIDANNDLNSSDLFYKRVLYRFFALSFDGQTPQFQISGVKDYWSFENYFFGKVNNSFVPVVPVTGKLKQIEGQNGNVLAFDFVAESFERFKSFFGAPLRLGRLQSGTPISDPVPVKGFQDNELKYQKYVISFFDTFNQFIFESNRYRFIKGPKEYIKEFFNFYFDSDISLLRSTYFLSFRNPGYSSGLSLMLADLNAADDKIKMDFIESPNFEFYRKAAINAGFQIDKNVPWRLNIDLKSPITVERYSSGGFSGVDFVSDTFSSYFTEAYRGELDPIIEGIFYGYRKVFERLPPIPEGDTERLQVCNTINEAIEPTLQNVRDSFPLTYWVGKYIEMKNQEAGSPFSDQKIQYIKNNTFVNRSQNFEDYINLKFRLPWLEPGSLVYERLRKEFKESGEKPLDNFSEHVKMIVMNSISSIY
jgi:hypothetical protein